MQLVLAMALGVAILTGVALASPKDFAAFNELYKPKEGTALAKAGCLTCHGKLPPSASALNPYGSDFKASKTKLGDATKALKAIEQLSSAKDGVSNIEKIKAGLLPGEPKPK